MITYGEKTIEIRQDFNRDYKKICENKKKIFAIFNCGMAKSALLRDIYL